MSSLIMHKRITTTVIKAKTLRTYVEPLITRSKEDTTHSRRIVFSYLQDKKAVTELFREVAPKIMERSGGYTRILKTGFRKGDAAEMCIIELVDYNQNMLTATKETKKTTTRRSRRSAGKKTGAVASAVTSASEIGKASVSKTAIVKDETVDETSAIEETTAVVEEETVVFEEVEEMDVVSETSEEENTKE